MAIVREIKFGRKIFLGQYETHVTEMMVELQDGDCPEAEMDKLRDFVNRKCKEVNPIRAVGVLPLPELAPPEVKSAEQPVSDLTARLRAATNARQAPKLNETLAGSEVQNARGNSLQAQETPKV